MPETGPMYPKNVTISRKRYKELREAEAWLRCLEQAGVDNWEGISLAHEISEGI